MKYLNNDILNYIRKYPEGKMSLTRNWLKYVIMSLIKITKDVITIDILSIIFLGEAISTFYFPFHIMFIKLYG